jgi:uncharacterized membrane protein
MNAVHLHLITNHVPIIGAFFGILVLVYGLIRKNPTTLAASYIVFIFSAATGLVAYFTGDGAAHAVKDLADVSRPIIKAHANIAKFFLVAYVLLAILSVIAFIKAKNHFDQVKKLAMIVLVISIITLGIGAYTGLLGGQIRHSEVRDPNAPAATMPDKDTDGDGDGD